MFVEAPMWIRRLLVVLIVFALCTTAEAQQPGKIFRIGNRRKRLIRKMLPHLRVVVFLPPVLVALVLALCFPIYAQPAKLYRIGILIPGDAWTEIIDGFRSGLKELGFEEGKQYSLTIRDWQGDPKIA